jgi:hypothetical protein
MSRLVQISQTKGTGRGSSIVQQLTTLVVHRCMEVEVVLRVVTTNEQGGRE